MLRGNDAKKKTYDAGSAFAQMALGKVGGSCVFIERKGKGKLIDTDPV